MRILIHLCHSLIHTCGRKCGPSGLSWWAKSRVYWEQQGQEAGTWAPEVEWPPWPGADRCDGHAGGGRGLSPGLAAGVCSQPGSSRHLGTCRTAVCSCLQPPQPQLREAQQILSVSKLSPKEIQKSCEHLFKVSDRSVGGSFHLQSKVVRGKEHLEEELRIQVPEDRKRAATQKITAWLLPSLPAHL